MLEVYILTKEIETDLINWTRVFECLGALVSLSKYYARRKSYRDRGMMCNSHRCVS